MLLTQVLSVPGTFAKPIEVLRAGKLMEKLETAQPSEGLDDWMKVDFPDTEISETQRDLLKVAVEKIADKLPVGKVTTSILEQLGFVDA